eukprot:2926253-Amphidinium_carterae.7
MGKKTYDYLKYSIRMLKRQRDTMSTMRTTRMTSRVTSTSYCSTSDSYSDFSSHLEDYVMTGEEDLYKEHYSSYSDMNRI